MFLVSLVATLYAAVAPQPGLLGQSGLGLLDYGLPWLFAAALWLRAGLIGGFDGKAAVTKAKGDTFEDVALLGITTQM